MEPEQVKGNNEPENKAPENEIDGTPLVEEKNGDISSASSTSSLEEEFDFVQKDDTLHNSSITDQNPSSSPVITTESLPQLTVKTAPEVEPSEMKSPEVQIMEQPPGYDPNRIPASVFSSKPTTPAEWSATSNESLFSIHMGNNSFSRDYAILFGKSGEFPRPEDWSSSQPYPFGKSGELPRLDEWDSQSNLRYEAKSNELSSLPPLMEVPSHEEGVPQSGELAKIDKKDDNQSPTAGLSSTTPDHGKVIIADLPANGVPDVKKSPPAEPARTSSNSPVALSSPSRFSDVSGNSGSSFAFPVLVNDTGKTAGSLKVVPEKPGEQLEKPQEQVSKEEANPTETKPWYSCFSCWPRCC